MVGEFVAKWSIRVIELNKKTQDGKLIDILDSKCHIVSNFLIKLNIIKLHYLLNFHRH
jgi:hypothetical protein